jgi:hypothetical protein
LSPWPLLAAFFVYNWIFLYGFTNYLFGVGMMLWAVAAWVAGRRANLVPRLLTITIMAVATLFCHLVAFGLLAVILGGLALTDSVDGFRATRRLPFGTLLLPAVPVGIALAIFVGLSPTAGAATDPILYSPWFGWKILVAYRTLLWSIPWLDAVTLGPLVILFIAVVWSRRLRIASRMKIPILLLILTFLAMPFALFGSLYGDARLPIAILLVTIASLEIDTPPAAILVPCAVLAAGLLIARDATIAFYWHAEEPVIAEYQHAFAALPTGSTLFVASTEPFPKLAYNSAAELARWHPPLKHLASLASIGREVFVPSTWADPLKQPVRILEQDAAAKQLQGDNPFQTPTADSLAEVVARIGTLREPGRTGREPGRTGREPANAAHEPANAAQDFLLLLRPDALVGTPPSDLVPIWRGSTFTLFRI